MLSPKEEQTHLRQGKPSFATFNFESSETSSITSDAAFGLSSPQSLEDKNKRTQNGDPLAKTTTGGGDNYSVTSSMGSSKYDDSLIFERLVQDPLIDGQAIPNSMPRHAASHNFIPSSLDTTTHIVNNPETTLADLDGDEIEYGFHSRRSSLANLEAAFATPSSTHFRKSSNTNLQSGFYKRGSYSQASLSRTSSNLTQQLLQDSSAPSKLSKTTSIPSLKLLNTNTTNSNSDLLPPLITTRSASSGTFLGPPRSAGLSSSVSPTSNVKNKCFCSYADLIAQDDTEMKSPIRRPSISASLSNSFSIARTNSATKARSPSVSLSQSLRGQSSFGRYSNKNTNSNNTNEEAVESSSVFSTSIDNNNNNNNFSSPLSRAAQDSRVSYSSRVNASLNNPQSMENFIN